MRARNIGLGFAKGTTDGIMESMHKGMDKRGAVTRAWEESAAKYGVAKSGKVRGPWFRRVKQAPAAPVPIQEWEPAVAMKKRPVFTLRMPSKQPKHHRYTIFRHGEPV